MHALSWVTNVLAFLAAVMVLVSVHEFGHYWVARRLGFKVLRFSVGFGKPLWMRRSGPDQTEYAISAIPLGGYVKLLDEREGPVASAELSRSFTHRPHWQRILVLLAGPAANFLLAILVTAAVYMFVGREAIPPVVDSVAPATALARAGLVPGDRFVSVAGHRIDSEEEVPLRLIDGLSADNPLVIVVRGGDGVERELRIAIPDNAERRRLSDPADIETNLGYKIRLPDGPALVKDVQNGPAQAAGLRRGDRVVAIDGVAIHGTEQLIEQVRAHAGRPLRLDVERDGGRLQLPMTPMSVTDKGQTFGRLNIAFDTVLPEPVRLGPLKALGAATVRAWDLTALQAKLLWRMVTGRVSVKNVSGPLTIAKLAGDSAIAGFDVFIRYLVFVSLALGFMNLLPIPILDGGQVVMQAIEWLKGSPLSERTQLLGQQVGILLVVLLVGLALFNDIQRQLG